MYHLVLLNKKEIQKLINLVNLDLHFIDQTHNQFSLIFLNIVLDIN